MSIVLTRPPRSSDSPPTAAGGWSGGGGSGWVTLATAANDIEAHLLGGRLGEAGVDVHVLKDRSAPGAWLYGGANPWAPVHVLVRKLQLDEARLVLAEISFEAPAVDRSIGMVAGRGWKIPVMWWSFALGLGLLFTGAALARTEAALGHCDLPLVCTDAAVHR